MQADRAEEVDARVDTMAALPTSPLELAGHTSRCRPRRLPGVCESNALEAEPFTLKGNAIMTEEHAVCSNKIAKYTRQSRALEQTL